MSTIDAFRAPRTPCVAAGASELHQGDMTASFAADVPFKTALEKLAQIGQWLPIDGNPEAPIGDLVDVNSTGPLRLGYGAWRDLLLGAQFTNGRGELISAGGRTVKNVAGFDLTKFLVGAAGVFGKLVSVTVRTYRRPESALLIRARPEVPLLGHLMATSLRPHWAVLREDALLLGYLADQRTINYYRTALPQAELADFSERTLEADALHRNELWQARGALQFRASVPPSRLADFTEALPRDSWVADAAFGIVLDSDVDENQIGSLSCHAESLGGSIRFTRWANQAPSISFSTNAVERQIIERLKIAFDADGSLNPLPSQIHSWRNSP